MIYTPELCIPAHLSGRAAWALMNQGHDWNTLFVCSEKQEVIGTLTDGDIRRGLLDKQSLEDPVSGFIKNTFAFITEKSTQLDSFQEFAAKGIRRIPVLDIHKKYVGHYDTEKTFCRLPVSALILAGGKGVRMQPLTLETPKPLLQIQGVPILGRILDHLIAYGIEEIHLALHHEAEKIQSFSEAWVKDRAQLKFILETSPLGTAGGLSLMESDFNWSLVLNADLMTDITLDAFYQAVVQSQASAGVVSTTWKTDVPYAVLEHDADYQLQTIKEKPELSFSVNAGIYLIHKKLISNMVMGERADMPDMIRLWAEKGEAIKVFPWSGLWKDLGRPEDFYSVGSQPR